MIYLGERVKIRIRRIHLNKRRSDQLKTHGQVVDIEPVGAKYIT